MSHPADLTRLRGFSDGTPEGLRALVQSFITHTSNTVAELRAVTPSSPADIHMLSHRAAGAAGACGATLLAELLRSVEASAKAGDLEGIEEQVAAVEIELARVRTFLRPLLEDDAYGA